MQQPLTKLIGLMCLLMAEPAFALCSTANLTEDFRQADIVVRARVVASTYVIDDEPNAAFVARWGGYSPVTLDRLKVIEVFKGQPGPTVNLFEEVSSGRYGVDFGEEYLIFLTYYPPSPSRGSAVRGAMYVRHTCGQTEKWAAVTTTKRGLLRSLAKAR